MRMRVAIWVCAGLVANGAASGWLGAQETAAPEADVAFVAGTTPDRRPEHAPRLTQYPKSDAWLKAARAGISDPLPPSLKFLQDQGGWFTPFTRPGMPGLYDLRGLHAVRAASANPAK